ncbi:GON-4-like protein-like [Scleropages formosus]|uniref:GON-4-like protein-like n=1 Tax=Scleropages formosus TaxID=113540 RepID=A0A0P7VIU9_SCLFO|nr:GON-4-like protein-like [Scleropages formosus]
MLMKHRRTVREQLAALRQYQALVGSKTMVPAAQCPSPPCTLTVTPLQKQQLQQQIQQTELQVFAQRGEQTRRTTEPGFVSIFRACNLQGAMSLLDELRAPSSRHNAAVPEPARPVSARSYPLLPPGLAWMLATRPVFLYPELLPCCSLDPSLHPPHVSTIYTQGENSLLVLGLRNFSETVHPYQLISQYLVCTKSPKQLRRHVQDMCQRRTEANSIKFYCQHKLVPSMPLVCSRVMPEQQCPPVEREETIMPSWLRLAPKPTVTRNNEVQILDASVPKRKSEEDHTFPNNNSMLPIPSRPNHPGTGETTPEDRADSRGLPSTNPSVNYDGGLWEEEEDEEEQQEEEEKDICREEEEEYRDYGEPLLALSESSASPPSSLESCTDSLEAVIDKQEETDGQRKGQQGRAVGMEGNAVLSVSTCRTKVSTGGKVQGQVGSKGQDDGGQVRETEHYTHTGGDKGQQSDGKEDFYQLIPECDEEEVMSSSSEKSVLSVPELQETMEKLSWLASEGRLYEEGDAENDEGTSCYSSTRTPSVFFTPVSQNSQVEEKGIYEDEELVLEEGKKSHLAGKSTVHMLHCNPMREKKDVASAQHGGNGPQWGSCLQAEELEDKQRKEQKQVGCMSPRKSRENEQRGETVPTQQSTLPSPVICAKNISFTPSGERVILWTREADRAILTACQKQGATKNTFQAVSAQLGNKSASEVAKRFRDLVRIFHAAAQPTSPECHMGNPGKPPANKPD